MGRRELMQSKQASWSLLLLLFFPGFSAFPFLILGAYIYLYNEE